MIWTVEQLMTKVLNWVINWKRDVEQLITWVINPGFTTLGQRLGAVDPDIIWIVGFSWQDRQINISESIGQCIYATWASTQSQGAQWQCVIRLSFQLVKWQTCAHQTCRNSGFRMLLQSSSTSVLFSVASDSLPSSGFHSNWMLLDFGRCWRLKWRQKRETYIYK